MDLQDFWQENKRWVLGVLAGLIVYWVASGVIDSSLGGESAVKNVRGVVNALKKDPLFDDKALKAARAENELLKQELDRVRSHVAFVPADEFVLAGKGDPDIYVPEQERKVRRDVFNRAQELGVDLDERDLIWSPPIGREEQESTLLDLCVLRNAAMRLLDASTEVLQRTPDALGLQGIESMKIDKRTTSSSRTARGKRDVNAGIAELIDEHKVRFDFRADLATLQTWLAKLRSEAPSIGLAPDLKVTPGDQIGDPIHVVGTLSAVIVRDAKQDG